jgi:hypothetical protein
MWRRVAAISTGVALLLVAAVVIAQQQQPVYNQGQVVRVDPKTSSVVVRTKDGNKEIDREYKVETGTLYYGLDRKPFFDGLTNKGWKQGTDVWYQLGTNQKQSTIMDMRMYNPATPPK